MLPRPGGKSNILAVHIIVWLNGCIPSAESLGAMRQARKDSVMALKVGLVGLRGIGLGHANAHRDDPLSNLVAVCDVVKERADSTSEKYGVKAYYSLAEMLKQEPDLDMVDVTTGGYENGSWHYEPA